MAIALSIRLILANKVIVAYFVDSWFCFTLGERESDRLQESWL